MKKIISNLKKLFRASEYAVAFLIEGYNLNNIKCDKIIMIELNVLIKRYE